jgi:ATP-dependent DNA helicase RecG
MAMAITPEQIDLWRQAPSEHQRLEFKEAKRQFDNRKLYGYCVALANESGGYILLGVSDRLPRRVVGTQAFRNPVAMGEKLHCALTWVMSERMTNESPRQRFHLPEPKRAVVSQVIAATIEAGLIKADEKVGRSRKYARYLPFWA